MRRPHPAPSRLHSLARRGSLFLLAGAGLAALLTGCSAGQISSTAKTHPAVQGATAQIGSIALRDMKVEYLSGKKYGKGDDAPLDLHLASSGSNDDVLTSVTTGQADSVVLNPGKGKPPVPVQSSAAPPSSPSARPPASPSAKPSASPSHPAGSPSKSGAPSGSPSAPTAAPSGPVAAPSSGAASPSASSAAPSEPGPSASSAPAGTAPGQEKFEIPVRAGQLVELTPGKGPYLVLHNLHLSRQPGETIRLTFHFKNAGAVTVEVPFVGPSVVTTRSPANIDEKPEKPVG